MTEKRIIWRLEQRCVSDLKPYEKNPRIITKEGLEQLKNSYDEIGVAQPININTDDTILSGHARTYQLMEEDPNQMVDVYVPDRKLTPKQEEAVIIRMNKNVAGQWDFEKLSNEFQFDDLIEWGFDEDELGITTEVLDEIEGQDDVGEIPKDPVAKKGDIWILGNHRVMCGDSTLIDDVEKLTMRQKMDMVYTDPPYGINEKCDRDFNSRTRVAKGNSFHQIKNDDSIDCAVDAFNLCEGLNIPRQIWWGANYYSHSIPQTNNWIVWDKRCEDKERDANSDCELAYVKSKWSSIRIFRHKWKGMIKGSEHGQKRVHPTQKPVALAEWCFDYYKQNFTNVLDLFLGSGSTIIACEKKEKHCFGMELDERYIDVIINRWQKLTDRDAVLESTGETFNALKDNRA